MHDYVFLVALAAGFGVVLATEAARHLGNTFGGILAASPITPTASAFLLADGAPQLLDGIASITATVLAILAGLVIASRGSRRHLWPLLGVAPAALLLSTLSAGILVAVALAIAALASCIRPVQPPQGARARLPIWVRFLAGAVPVVLVALSVDAMPLLAPLLAVSPILFVSTLLAAHTESPALSARMLSGGAAGSMGVLAFIVAVQPLGLAAAWLVFATVSLAWRAMGAWVQVGRNGPTPVPAAFPVDG